MARHFTLQDRDFLDRLLKKGLSKAEIAELMGRDRSTIYRELRRNSRLDRRRQTLDFNLTKDAKVSRIARLHVARLGE